MTYLTSNQLKQYKDEGYVAPVNVLTKDEANEIRNEIELIEKIMPEELQKWLDTMPKNCGYELASFKRGEYYGEKQIKLFLRRK